jgi:hypothetical protein
VAARNRFLIGAGNVSVGAGSGTFNPSTGKFTTAAGTAHSHSIAGEGAYDAVRTDGIVTSKDMAPKGHDHGGYTGNESAHTHDLAMSSIPYYAVLVCMEK